MANRSRPAVDISKAIDVFSFHFRDISGKENPHFTFTKAIKARTKLRFLCRTSISNYLEIVEASLLSENLTKLSCLAGYIRRREDLLKHYRQEIATIEYELSRIKYIDPDNIPSIESI